MFRRVVAIVVLSGLTGCLSSPPKGPLVEFRDGITPITRPSPCEADYVLRSASEPESLAVLHVAEGTRVGFRREQNQSVTAIGPAFELPLSPGEYVWEVVPGSVPSWAKRAKRDLRRVATGTGVLAAAVALFGLEAMLADDDPKPLPGEPNGVIIPAHKPAR